MCLAIPGRIVHRWEDDDGMFAIADFAGKQSKICLDFLPEAQEGDYVAAHAGFALTKIDPAVAQEVIDAADIPPVETLLSDVPQAVPPLSPAPIPEEPPAEEPLAEEPSPAEPVPQEPATDEPTIEESDGKTMPQKETESEQIPEPGEKTAADNTGEIAYDHTIPEPEPDEMTGADSAEWSFEDSTDADEEEDPFPFVAEGGPETVHEESGEKILPRAETEPEQIPEPADMTGSETEPEPAPGTGKETAAENTGQILYDHTIPEPEPEPDETIGPDSAEWSFVDPTAADEEEDPFPFVTNGDPEPAQPKQPPHEPSQVTGRIWAIDPTGNVTSAPAQDAADTNTRENEPEEPQTLADALRAAGVSDAVIGEAKLPAGWVIVHENDLPADLDDTDDPRRENTQ